MTTLGIAGGGLTIAGALLASWRFFYRRGADERELTLAVRENTRETRALSESMRHTVDTVNNHETRISVLESR